jgi:hypothetical protein
MEKWLSRKLFVALVTDLLAVILAFGGHLSPEQVGAVITLSGTVYMIANAVAARGK